MDRKKVQELIDEAYRKAYAKAAERKNKEEKDYFFGKERMRYKKEMERLNCRVHMRSTSSYDLIHANIEKQREEELQVLRLRVEKLATICKALDGWWQAGGSPEELDGVLYEICLSNHQALKEVEEV